jgi:hypothetical protein
VNVATDWVKLGDRFGDVLEHRTARYSIDFLNRANLDSLRVFVLDAEVPENLHS